MMESKVVPGGKACELAVTNYLSNRAKLIQGEEQFPFKAVAKALEVIPRTLSQNCGANTIRTLTELRAKENGFHCSRTHFKINQIRDLSKQTFVLYTIFKLVVKIED